MRQAGVLGQRDAGPSARTPALCPTPVPLAGEGLDNILILSICGGGLTFLIFVALLIVYVSKRNKQHRGRSGKLPPPRRRGAGPSPRGNNSRG